MTLPPTWPTVPVFGTYLRVDGTPNEGSVWFETSQRVVVLDENGLTIGVVPRRIIADLDAAGHFALNLPCTDAGAQPTGWTWQVYERFNSGQPVYSIEVPQALIGVGINLVQYPHAVPVPVAPPVVSYLTTADIGVTVADQIGVDNAISTANAAATTASAAQAAAASAVTTANNASATANAIDGKAQTALDDSAAAVATANAASATATAAQNTANAIDGKAQTALDDSAAAVATANAASATANAILPITVAKMLGTASVAGQVPVSQGAGVAPAWGWASPGFKNWLINGNFDWWQRGTAFSGVTYTADRWLGAAVGSGGAYSAQAFAANQTVVPNGPAAFLRTVVTSVAGAGNSVNVTQKVEDVRLLAGKTITVSFWAKADAARPMGVGITQNFGTGGSPSPNADMPGQKVNLTAAWKYFTMTFAVPAIGANAIGTSTPGWTGLRLYFDAGANSAAQSGNVGQQSGTFDIAQAQLEVGGIATPFEMRPFQVELALCQRYFEKSYSRYVAPGSTGTPAAAANSLAVSGLSTASANLGQQTVQFAVCKAGTPVIIVYSPNTGAAGKIRDVINAVDVTTLGANATDKLFTTWCTQSSATNTINFQFHWTADAEL